MEMQQKVAVVTGGASGLGEACVRQILAEGGKTAILDFDDKRGPMLAEELGEAALFCKTDVVNAGSVSAAIELTMARFGAIHVAINCAGVANPGKVLGKDGPLPIEQFDRVVQINLIGTMNVIRLAAEQMTKNPPGEDGEKGVVINTASIAAFEGQIGQAAYSASKAGVVGLTLPIAREFASYGIRVMCVAPGLFLTPMMAAFPEKVQAALAEMVPFPKRLGKPEEFATLVKQIIRNPALNGGTIRLDSAIRMSAK